jgi:hypothetical protein
MPRLFQSQGMTVSELTLLSPVVQIMGTVVTELISV